MSQSIALCNFEIESNKYINFPTHRSTSIHHSQKLWFMIILVYPCYYGHNIDIIIHRPAII